MAHLEEEVNVLLYLWPSWSDRDKALLHKVAGRTGGGAQRHSTCQQSHGASGIHSSLRTLHPIFRIALSQLIHSLQLNYFVFFSSPLIVFSHFLPFSIFSLPTLFHTLSLESYFPPAFWDQTKMPAKRAVQPKSLVVLIECIILLMSCHFCWIHWREAELEHPTDCKS